MIKQLTEWHSLFIIQRSVILVNGMMIMHPSKLIFVLLLLGSPPVFATQIVCSSTPPIFGFANGVWNSPKAALKTVENLRTDLKLNHIELFYNHTEGAVSDLLEAAEQRRVEALVMAPPGKPSFHATTDLTEMLGVRDRIQGGPTSAALQRHDQPWLAPLRPGLQRAAATGSTSMAGRPITQDDYRDHQAQLQQLWAATPNVPFVLIAHSQGNLFANHLVSSLTTLERAKIHVIHVAPATNFLNGPYVLADKDLIITPLVAHRPTVSIPGAPKPFGADLWGHAFLGTYWNEAMPKPRSQVLALIQNPSSSAETQHRQCQIRVERVRSAPWPATADAICGHGQCSGGPSGGTPSVRALAALMETTQKACFQQLTGVVRGNYRLHAVYDPATMSYNLTCTGVLGQPRYEWTASMVDYVGKAWDQAKD